MRRLLLGICIVFLATMVSGCDTVEKDIAALREKIGLSDSSSGKFPPSDKLLKEAQALPQVHEDKEKGFSFRYPKNWTNLETYDGGDVSIDRLNEKGEKTGAFIYITIYDNDPSEAPTMTEKLFAIETEKQLKAEGWTEIKMGKVSKHQWQGAAWFVSEYEGMNEGHKTYDQEYYWEDGNGKIRIIGVSFIDKDEMVKAQPEIDRIVYSLNANLK